MGLQAEIPNQFGLNTKYWKIVEINKNWLERRSHVVMLGWHSQGARDEYPSFLPMDSRTYDWSGDDFPFTADCNELEIAYSKIKALTTRNEEGDEIQGEFVNAIDV